MTIENTVKNVAAILADMIALRDQIEATNPRVGNYVLRWFNEGSSLYVGNGTRDPHVTGFNRAIFFGDREAAIAFLRATNIRNGKQESPEPVNAFNAKQGALADIAGVIKTLEAMQPK